MTLSHKPAADRRNTPRSQERRVATLSPQERQLVRTYLIIVGTSLVKMYSHVQAQQRQQQAQSTAAAWMVGAATTDNAAAGTTTTQTTSQSARLDAIYRAIGGAHPNV
jgi:hypothetical protein